MKRTLGMMFFAGALLSMGAGPASAATATASHSIDINVSEVALLALDDSAAATFTIGAPASGSGGAAFGITKSNTTKYLRYTSIVEAAKHRTITAEIDTATSLPSIFHIMVSAANAVDGCGTLGTAVSSIELSSTATPIVTGIGSGYTKTGANSGVKVEYSLDEVTCTDAGSCNVLLVPNQINVLYTLTEDL